jgi:transposase
MKFYTETHKYYCGIDLHTKNLYVCLIDHEGEILVHKNIKARPEDLMKLVKPYVGDLVIGVECMFSWYWIADFCEDNGIDFVLGHALYMKAIHGGKAKNDKIDSLKNRHPAERGYVSHGLCLSKDPAPHPGPDASSHAYDA